MANVKITELIPQDPAFEGFMLLDVNGAKTKAVYSFETGARIIISGEDLKIDPSDEGLFSKGTVEKVVFKDGDGNEMIVLSDLKFAAKNIGAIETSEGAHGFYELLLGGKDTITGSAMGDNIDGRNGNDHINGGKGNDTLYGGYGDDVLKGGQGTDVFIIDPQGSKDNDFITDFDIKGPAVDTLAVDETIETITKTDQGRDTLITFDNGSTLQLDNITKADFLDYWMN